MGLLHSKLGSEKGEKESEFCSQVKVGSPCFLLSVRLKEESAAVCGLWMGLQAGRQAGATAHRLRGQTSLSSAPHSFCTLSRPQPPHTCNGMTVAAAPWGCLNSLTSCMQSVCDTLEHLAQGEHNSWWPRSPPDDLGSLWGCGPTSPFRGSDTQGLVSLPCGCVRALSALPFLVLFLISPSL